MKNLGLLALALSVCLLTCNISQAATYVWDAGGVADTSWTQPLNWGAYGGSAADTVPLATDSARFDSNVVNTKTITLPAGTTTVDSVTITGWSATFTFANAAATLSVTNNFNFLSGFNQDGTTFAPVVSIGGQLISTYNPSICGYPGRMIFSNSGNSVGGGINAANESFRFAGNNNIINGGITVMGNNSKDWAYAGGAGLVGAGVVDFAGTGDTISGALNLNRYGTVFFEKVENLSTVSAINWNGGMLRLAPGTRENITSALGVTAAGSGTFITGLAGGGTLTFQFGSESPVTVNFAGGTNYTLNQVLTLINTATAGRSTAIAVLGGDSKYHLQINSALSGVLVPVLTGTTQPEFDDLATEWTTVAGVRNTYNPAITNLNVGAGSLFVNANTLDYYAGTITLGSANDFGKLMGGNSFGTYCGYYAYNSAPIANNIILSGRGGIIRASTLEVNNPNTYQLDIGGNISGDGRLIKMGVQQTAITGTNTYAGGTIVAEGNLRVGTRYHTNASTALVTTNIVSSLGTGKVWVPYIGVLDLWNASLVAGNSILVEKSGAGYGGVLFSGQIRMEENGYMPVLDPNSDGIFKIFGGSGYYDGSAVAGTALRTALNTAPPGNGKMWFGSEGFGYVSGGTASALAPGLPDTVGGNNIYRISSGAIHGEANIIVLTYGTGIFADRGGVPSDVYVYNGCIGFQGDVNPNPFTGTLTVRNSLMNATQAYFVFPWSYNNGYGGSGSTATGTPFGAATGDVKLMAGALWIQNAAATSAPIVKDDLSISGLNMINAWSGNAAWVNQIGFNTLTRTQRGTLIIRPNLTLGSAEKELFGNITNDANGMTPAYMVAMNGYGTGDFLSIDTGVGTNGVSKLPFVAMPTPGTGAEIAQTAGETLTANVSVHALRVNGALLTGGAGKDTVTVGSGGIILTGSGLTHTVNFQAGTGAGGNKEMLLWGNSSGNVTLNGKLISSVGLTYSGTYYPTILGAAVDNTTTLVGDIYVNGGRLAVSGGAGDTATTPLTSPDKQLGAASNRIILNGGQIAAAVASVYNHHEIVVGPVGGSIGQAGATFRHVGVISDLDSANPGFLVWSGGDNQLYAGATPNTFSGTSVFTGGRLWLMGTAIPGTGPIVLNNGTLEIWTSQIADMRTSSVTIVGTGVLRPTYYGAKIGSLQGAGAVVWGDPYTAMVDGTITVGYDNKSTSFFGEMYDLPGRNAVGGALTKVGTGTLTLWNDVNWHGPTNIDGGTLAFQGHFGGGSYTATGNMNVNAGGTLGGSGTIDRNVIVNGGTVNMTNGRINGVYTQYSGSTTGSSTIVVSAGNYFELDGGSFTGTHAITADYVLLEGGTFSGNNTITTPYGLYLNGYSYDPGSIVTGTGTISGGGDVNVYGGSFGGTYTITGNMYVGDYNMDYSYPIVAPGTSTASGALNISGVFSTDTSTTTQLKLGAVADKVTSGGNMTLAGNLVISAVQGFSPGIGTTVYTVLESTGGTIADSSAVDVSALPSSVGYLTYTYGLTGDSKKYNVTYDRAAVIPFVWTGGGANANWSTLGNWDIGIAPLPTDTITFNLASSVVALDGAYSNTAGIALAGDLTLNGPGSLTVGGGITGAGAINVGGTLNLASNIGPDTNAVTVSGTLTGAGTISRPVAFTGSTLTPGTVGTAGTIVVNGDFSSSASTVFNFDVGTTLDQLNVNGNITAINGTVVANPVGFTPGTPYTLFNYTGSLTGGIGGLALNASALPAPSSYFSPYTLSDAIDKKIQLLSNRIAHTFTWTNTGADTKWITPANWSPNNGLIPSSVDTANFAGVGGTVILPDGPSTVANVTITQDWIPWTFTNAAATLNVTGTFNCKDTWSDVNFAPVLNAGQLVTIPTYVSAVLTLSNNNNTVTGGVNSSGYAVVFAGNGNTVGTGITVKGDSTASWTSFHYGLGAGGVAFNGTGNVFSGTWNLNKFGYVDLQQTSDLTGVTAINFNGGMLRLRGAGNTFDPSITNLNVATGTLWAGTDALSAYTGTISLGSDLGFGTLAGGTLFYNGSAWVDHAVANSITLNGLGGRIRAYQAQGEPGEWSVNSVSGNISGSGRLIKIGPNVTTLSGTNTYTGDTLVGGGYLRLTSSTSLGTGNARVFAGGVLQLTSAANMDAAATLQLNKSGAGFGGVLFSGLLEYNPGMFYGTFNDYLPNLTSDSNGILQVYSSGVLETHALIAAMQVAPLGDGTMWLGGQNWSFIESDGLQPGAPMTPGGLPTYRFSSGALNQEASLAIYNGYIGSALQGDADVVVYNGGVWFADPQKFTGTLRVRNTLLGCWGQAGAYPIGAGGTASALEPESVYGNSPFGSDTGNVVLEQGFLGLNGAAGGHLVNKGDLSFTGGNLIQLNSYGDNLTELTFATLTRLNRGTLVIKPSGADVLGVGGMDKLRVTALGAAALFDPYIVSGTGVNTGSFVAYDATDGFATVPFVAFTGSEVGGTAIAQATAPTAVTTADVLALRADAALSGGTVTLQSGGLILTGNAISHTTNFAAPTGKEMVIFASNDYWWGAQQTISGTINSDAGLTKFGEGQVYLSGDNTTTLFGDITINQGSLDIYRDYNLGDPGNTLILNGGTLYATPIDGSMAEINRPVKVGPAGGTITGAYYGAFNFLQPIEDLDPSNPGTLYIGNNTNRITGHNTFSGTVVFSGGGSWIVDAWVSGIPGADGIPGTGPIVITSNGYLSIFRSTIPDLSTSSVTITGYSDTLGLATCGAMIGSLNGDGDVRWGDIWSGQYDMTLSVGYDNKSTDFFGQMFEIEGRTGNVTKEGTGTLTLWGDMSWHGPTNINGGTLQINGSLSNGIRAGGDVNVNAGTLGIRGTVERNVLVATGAKLNLDNGKITGYVDSYGEFKGHGTVGGDFYMEGGSVSPNGGTLNVGGAFYTLQVGSAFMTFNLSEPGNAANDKIAIAGDLETDFAWGTTSVNIVNAGGFTEGTYTLMTYGGNLYDSPGTTFVLGATPMPTYLSCSLISDIANKKFNLVVSRLANTFVWTGLGTDTNWTNGANWDANNGLSPIGIDTASMTLAAGGTHDVTVDAPASVAAIGFTGTGDWNVSGSSITVGTGGFTYASSGSSVVSAPIAGTGAFNVSGGGVLELQGTHTYSALTGVANATLTVTGTLDTDANTVTVNAGGVLNGTGFVRRPVHVNGGTLAGTLSITGDVTSTSGIFAPGSSAGTIYVDGNLVLDSASMLNFELGAPGSLGTSDLIDITGNLTLDGTLNVAALEGFNEGTYRLFNYALGGLSDLGLTIGTTPGMGFNYEISTATDGQIDLLVSTPWDLYDTNHDGVKDSLDIDAIFQNFTPIIGSYQWDVDQDGDVDKDDVTAELNLGFLTNYADANLDTKVDLVDFQALLDNWQNPGGWDKGDFTGDGLVEFEDFQVLLDYWNPSGIWNFSQVPEPTTMVLLALGGLALLRRNRRA